MIRTRPPAGDDDDDDRRHFDSPSQRRRSAGRPARHDPEATLIGQLRRRLLDEHRRGRGPGPDAADPPPVRRRAAELLDAVRRVAPSPLVVAGHDADAALLLDARGLAELDARGPRPGLMVLRLPRLPRPTRGGRGWSGGE